MKVFNWFGREIIQEDVRSYGRDEFIVKLPVGEVKICAELGSRPTRWIYAGTAHWSRGNSRALTEEDKQLAVEKLCEFLLRRKISFEVR